MTADNTRTGPTRLA